MALNKNVKETAKKIKKLEIQGASKVRKNAVLAIKKMIQESKAGTVEDFKKELKENMLALHESRPTEPGMRTALRNILKEANAYSELEKMKKHLIKFCTDYEKERERAMEEIANLAVKKIPQDAIVLTHCHSHTVEEILKLAWEQGKLKHVVCTESRPMYQGRITAKTLSGFGIPTTLIVDSAVATFIKEVNLFFSGSDAIIADGSVVNKIGTRGISLICQEHRVPHYVVSGSGKFDPLTFYGQEEVIEERAWQEVWEKKPRNENLHIKNPAFDVTESELVKEIITELGVFSPKQFANFMVNKLALDKKQMNEVSLQYLLK